MAAHELVLLGTLDANLKESDSSDFKTNKIGGFPDWMSCAKDLASIKCSICSKESVLVTQLYCPLGESSYHRTLYLFCCVNPLCWNKSQSWTAVRCQERGDKKEVGVSCSETWLEAEDNWDLKEDCTDLCSATQNLVLPQEEAKHCQDFEMEDSCQDGQSSQEVIPETIRTSFVGQLPWKSHVTTCSSGVFAPYFISVFEEPSEEGQMSDYIQTLVQEYQKHAGNPFSLKDSEKPSVAEVYEKSEVKHGDRIFYKFQKRVSKFPQQVIRYNWCGEPLLLRPNKEAPPPCPVCGAIRVFELQLMPALVSALKINGSDAVEFGTVIVSSCQRSCWQDVVAFEHVLVQSDPDQYLFQI